MKQPFSHSTAEVLFMCLDILCKFTVLSASGRGISVHGALGDVATNQEHFKIELGPEVRYKSHTTLPPRKSKGYSRGAPPGLHITIKREASQHLASI